MYRHANDNLGYFKELEEAHEFTFRKTKDKWALDRGMLHEIDVLDDVRFGNVKKTVVHICVDEGADGKPVMDKWKVRTVLFADVK